MEQKRNLTFEQQEFIRITQEIIKCDTHIQRLLFDGLYHSEECEQLVQKKAFLEFELDQLNPEEL